MSIYQRGETYVHRVTIKDRNGIKTDPSTVSETIKDPCDYILVNNMSMASSAVGEYYYNYNLSSNATFGRYKAQVVATSAGGNKAVFNAEFFVMPWDGVDDVRQTMGCKDEKSISNDDISSILWNCYVLALYDVHEHHYLEQPSGNVDTGYSYNGSNVSFQTRFYPIADINGDGTVSGNNVSCSSDMDGYWIDTNGHYQRAIIKMKKYQYGEIEIYQSNGTSAIPSTADGLFIDYWVRYHGYNQTLFEQAVVRLTCYEISKRFASLDKITLADISRNNPIITIDPNMYYKEYKRYLKMNRPIIIGGV